MMMPVKVLINKNFIDGVPVYVFYNDIDKKYHCDFDLENPMGTLGVFNEIEVQNEIYVLMVIDEFCTMCEKIYNKMVEE